MKGKKEINKMAIENFDEVKAYFDTNKDNEDVKGYIGGLVTPDRVNSFLESEDGKKLLQPKLDSYHTKGLKTWQDKNLNSLVDAEVKKRFPDADPRDVELKKLQAQLDQMQKETLHKDLTNKALKTATEKKLPSDLIDYFIGADEETTNKNLEKFIATMSAHDEAIRTEFAKGNSYTPPNNKGNVGGDEKLRAEIQKYMK
jgi:hypothetical protein